MSFFSIECDYSNKNDNLKRILVKIRELKVLFYVVCFYIELMFFF